MMHGRMRLAILLTMTCVGCTETAISVSPDDVQPETALGESFDPAATGTIQGRVVWDGDIPDAKEEIVRAIAFKPNSHKIPLRFTTPHVPQVHKDNRGVSGAVVFLRGVDPRRAKAWDHAPVRVEFHARRLEVQQGTHRGPVGFVRRGSRFEIVNRDADYHNLHGRGAAFFAAPIIKGQAPQTRQASKEGIVDLTCGAGYFWMHAHLFVTEHPYFARTDADGRFSLNQVPAGSYEVVSWLPSWRVEQKQRDPEMSVVVRWIWQAPREQVRTVHVDPGRVSEVEYRWTARRFE
ncbi:MAG: carboxypeptidase regulatory-like domain-containing protein [Planctomycetes bacterium]|nr:carboxypeptidase regulatory-like domain-containing protein [Planctomycetota bacterium]